MILYGLKEMIFLDAAGDKVKLLHIMTDWMKLMMNRQQTKPQWV